MDKVRLQCFGALYGNGQVPSAAEVKLQLEREQAAVSFGESERKHQMRLHRWLTQRYIPHYAPFNEGYQNEKAARAAKMMGMSPGICDIVIIMARKPYHGLYMELKCKPYGRIGGAQEWWLKTLALQSYAAHVSWSFEESIKIVEEYLALPHWESAQSSICETNQQRHDG